MLDPSKTLNPRSCGYKLLLNNVEKIIEGIYKALKAPAVSVNASILKEHLLKLDPNFETTSRKKEFFISFKDDLVAPLEYFREDSLQNRMTHLSRAAHVIHFNAVRQKRNLAYLYPSDST